MLVTLKSCRIASDRMEVDGPWKTRLEVEIVSDRVPADLSQAVAERCGWMAVGQFEKECDKDEH